VFCARSIKPLEGSRRGCGGREPYEAQLQILITRGNNPDDTGL
jgi:hypothetical protein